MDQSRSFKKGDVVRIFDTRPVVGMPEGGIDLGVWELVSYDVVNMQIEAIQQGKLRSQTQTGDLTCLRLEHIGCNHEWTRVNMFRFDSFCCKHCPVTRPFDKEKDEAA